LLFFERRIVGGFREEEGIKAGLTATQSLVLRLAGFRVNSSRIVAHEGSLWSALVSKGWLQRRLPPLQGLDDGVRHVKVSVLRKGCIFP
jgi:hypothetical protein